jgi:hypothetical protein
MSRRGLITGLISLVAAPAIVRATSIMPVRSTDPALLIRNSWGTGWLDHPNCRCLVVPDYAIIGAWRVDTSVGTKPWPYDPRLGS